jgi:hypothetical protein
MKITPAFLSVVKPARRRLFQFFAAALDRRRRGALLAVLALPCFSGQGGTPPPFPGMAGIYDGLFSSSAIGMATEETAGKIANLTLNDRGSYSGVVLLGGSGFGISGNFAPDGSATNVVTNALDGHVRVELHVNGNSPPRTITGLVSGTNSIVVNGASQAGWASEVVLVASLTNTANFPGAYTMLIPPAADSDGTNSPLGYGHARLTNTLRTSSAPAAVTIIGLLADWSSIGTTMRIREDNGLPIYLNYYNTPQPGMLFGMLNLVSNPPYVPSGNLTWIRKAGRPGMFTNGFTNNYPAVLVSPWSNSVPLSNVIAGNQLVLSGGGLTTPLTYSVKLDGTNLALAETSGSTNHASGYVNPDSGHLTITFTNDRKVTVTGKGDLLQNRNVGPVLGGGFFIVGPQATPTNSGSISLLSPAP